MNSPAIDIRSATLAYENICVFKNIDLHLAAKQWTALLGRSGVGKTSLLRMIAGLTLPKEKIQGTIIADNLKPVSQQIAYMAQTDLLLPWLNIIDNVMLSAKLSPTNSATKTQAITLLDAVGLSAAKQLYPQQLSGGMRQRAALVRTLLADQPIVLMDEPFSALDAITRYKLQNLAADLLHDKTVFFITHDPTEALRLAHNIYMMTDHPATLKHITTLSSKTPRDLNDPLVIEWQTKLFRELL
jgi:putative hydroxymethylpyrimidine transport system ATP-binding protein